MGRFGHWLQHHPYGMLIATNLMWAGNNIASRVAVGNISPMTLTFLRWVLVCAVLAVVSRRELIAAWPQLKPRLVFLTVMGAAGFTGFNIPFYWAAHHTTAVNMTILQGAMPALVLVGALAVFRTPITLVQALGTAVTLVGVAVLATRGDLAHLSALAFNAGDLGMLFACTLYSGYTLGLRNRPKVSGMAFFTALAVVAMVTSAPFMLVEIARGDVLWPNGIGLACIVYIAILPSFLGQVLYLRAVELIGPSRAMLFINLVPVFGSLMAVVLLSEPFGLYHAVALTMVLGGILLAEFHQIVAALRR